MIRVASVIAIVLLGALAGCRTVSPTRVAGHYDETIATDSQPITGIKNVQTDLRPVAFIHEAAEIDAATEADAKQELLPLANPSTNPSTTPSATPDTPLSLDDVEGMAFQSNPTLASAAARLDAARGQQMQAGRYPNPIVGYHATEIGNLGRAGQQGAFVSQRFITGGKLRLDQAIAGKAIDEAHFRFHAQELRVLNDVRVRFYEKLVAQRRVELTLELAGIGDDLVKATQTLLHGRLGTENDLLQAEIRAEDAHILLDNARNENLAAWRRLTAVIGVSAMQMVPLAGEVDSERALVDWDESFEKTLGGNPDLAAARMRVERANIAIERARREPVPNVELSVSVRHHNVTRHDVANVQVGLPIPIFDRNRGNIRSAEADWIATNNELRRIELDLQDRLAVVYRRYSNARQQTDRYRQRMLPKAQKSLDLVMRGYQQGQVEYLTLLTAQQTYLHVNLAYLDSLQELWASSALIEGQLLQGSLK